VRKSVKRVFSLSSGCDSLSLSKCWVVVSLIKVCCVVVIFDRHGYLGLHRIPSISNKCMSGINTGQSSPTVEGVVDNEVVDHVDSVRLHWVTLTIRVIENGRLAESPKVTNMPLSAAQISLSSKFSGDRAN
jgi:hypothetical protein